MRLMVAITVLASVAAAQSNVSRYLVMPAIFSDNMVLQQKSMVPVWGKADPGSKVMVEASWGGKASTIVKRDSSWMVRLTTRKAGGPYELTISVGDTTVTYRNVMLGEVWVCSGQSNMEIPIEGWPPENPIKNSAEEIDSANFPDIRLFTVARAYSAAPDFNCVGKWTECAPKTAAPFSAVGYFFGRELYRKLHVPIGLISSVWGGTKIQPWISGRFLSRMPEYQGQVDSVSAVSRLADSLGNWIRSHPVVDVAKRNLSQMWENLEFGDSACSEVSYNDSSWRTMKLPVLWQTTSAGRFNGVVWFRRTVDIPKSWINSSLVLDLGPVDDMDETWVNGVKVGGILKVGFYATPRVYEVPGSIVRDTTLTIAVRVIDNGGFGGIWGNGVRMEIHPEIDSSRSVLVSGDWRYMPVAEYMGSKFYVYGPNGEFYSRPQLPFPIYENTPTALLNGMIAPLIPYRIKGVIWYQGESNSALPDDYNNYKFLLPLMIRNWRADWHEGKFPFYYVQIAPWTYGAKSKSYVVRDAQRLALSVPNTGMAVTLDIASLTTIHPPDKQDVGLRLALWALDKNYGIREIYSGPIYRSMKVKSKMAIIYFKHTDGGLVFKPMDGETNFVIAGRDGQFVKAGVKVAGRYLEVYSPGVPHPVAVRYTWSNEEEATLFNKAGLPASTFRTDNWQQ